MRSKLLGIAVIATLSLTGCSIGRAATSETDSAVKAAACARAQTLDSQIRDIQAQILQMTMHATGGGPFGEKRALERQKVPLAAELVAQDTVCKG